jgi:hypothetical protein
LQGGTLLGSARISNRCGELRPERADNATASDSIYEFHCGLAVRPAEGETMLILLVILLLLAFGAFPTWPYSRGWGYYPSGGLGLILLIVLIIALVNNGL